MSNKKNTWQSPKCKPGEWNEHFLGEFQYLCFNCDSDDTVFIELAVCSRKFCELTCACENEPLRSSVKIALESSVMTVFKNQHQGAKRDDGAD